MYRISLPALKETKEAYGAVKQKLKEQQEVMQQILAGITEDIWQGEDASLFKESMQDYLSGAYTENLMRIEGIEKALGTAVYNACVLKQYCEKFTKPLQGEAIGMLEENDNCTGRLYCNPDKTTRIINCSTQAVVNAAAVSSLANVVDWELGSLQTINFDSHIYTDAIRSSCTKIGYLEDFSAAFKVYTEQVALLDRNLAQILLRYTTEDVQGAENRYKTLQIVPETQDIEMILYLSKDVLARGADSWTAEEAQMVAQTWNMCIDTQNTEGIEGILAQLQYIETTEEGKYEICLNQEKIGRIMEYLNPYEQGNAYFTLSRAGKFYGSFCKPPVITVRADKEKDEIKLILTADSDSWFDKKSVEITAADLYSGIGEEGIATMNRLGFSDGQIVGLLKNVYTDQDQAFVYQLFLADETEEYAQVFLTDPNQLSTYMSGGLYQYSYLLADNHLSHAEDGTITAMDFGRLETFLNGILSSQSTHLEEIIYETEFGNKSRWEEKTDSYAGEYLGLLAGESEFALEQTAGYMYVYYSEPDVIRPLIPVFNKQADMCALYTALLYQKTKTEAEHEGYAYQDKVYQQISELKLDVDMTEQNGNLSGAGFLYRTETLQDGKSLFGTKEQHVSVQRIIPTDCEVQEKIQHYIDAVHEKKMAIPKAALDNVQAIIGIGCPAAAIGIEAAEVYGNAEQTGKLIWESVSNAADGNESVEGAVGVVSTIYSSAWDIYNKYQAAAAAENALLAGYFKDGICINIDGETIEVISQGTYHVNTLLKTAYFYQEGLSFLYEGDKEEVTELIRNEKDVDLMNDKLFEGMDEAARKNILSIVWCGEALDPNCPLTIWDLSDAQISVCIRVIGQLDKNREGSFDLKLKSYDVLEEKIYEER
ncbi:MAG: hypothetical protein UFG06_07160 [Lachnospiraceae bacterium]|nr:hypothetical protein [Lachnospiraceae bacterium]